MSKAEEYILDIEIMTVLLSKSFGKNNCNLNLKPTVVKVNINSGNTFNFETDWIPSTHLRLA